MLSDCSHVRRKCRRRKCHEAQLSEAQVSRGASVEAQRSRYETVIQVLSDQDLELKIGCKGVPRLKELRSNIRTDGNR
jgi:hypothetical protein